MEDEARHAKVMIVEDDEDVARAVTRLLRSEGHDVESSTEAQSVLARVDAGQADWDVVLLDVGLPETNGLDVLKHFRASGAPCSVIMLTGDGSAATATDCMRAGAFYYLTKPFEAFQLSATVQSAMRHARMRRELASVKRAQDEWFLIGRSTAMLKLLAAVERLAQQDVSILIQGESGTGKELVARALHDRGARRGKRFVAVNCGAIPESLIDSELFGHIKGSFTGATVDRAGVFVEADGGTLFLDEIGDMPLPVQSRFLRVLQEGEVRAVGGNGVRQVDVRVVAASNIELAGAVAQQRFREDLFYRLNVVVLRVPPLRERDGDVPLLAAHFLKKHGGEHPPALAPDALDALASFPWPGNVRQLENALLHALAMRHGDAIGADVLPHAISGRVIARGERGDDVLVPLTEAKRRASADFEKRYLVQVMERAKGSVSEAARLAGLDRTNFRRLLQRHAIDPVQFK